MFLTASATVSNAQAASRLNVTQLAEVPKKLQELVQAGEIAGAVALVATASEAKTFAVGERDIVNHVPMKEDDLFWIASMTKPMTAVCVAMMVEEGKLAIDDPVEKHLPEFRGQWLISEESKDKRVLVRPARPITIRDLLTHTAGLGDVAAPRPDCSLAELTMAYSREPLRFPPGSKWSYSNPAINTLGRLVEVASGISFPQFMETRLLEPLGMKETTFWPSAEQAERLAKSYNQKDGKLQETDIYFLRGAPLTDHTRTAFASGGLFSTAADMLRFYRMILAGGTLDGHRYLKQETVAEMTRTQTGDIKTGFVDGMSWGLGFQVVKEPEGITAGLSTGTFGHGGAYGTQSWGDPKKGAIYILMFQRAGLPNGDASGIRRAFQDAATAAVE
jgi:CubicO group peptidase (beta-lactamase class C family)